MGYFLNARIQDWILELLCYASCLHDISFCVHFYFICVCSLVRYDSRVKAMEVDEKPTETYSDIGGLDKQIEEVNNNRKSMYM